MLSESPQVVSPDDEGPDMPLRVLLSSPAVKGDIVVRKTLTDPLPCVCKKNTSDLNAGISHSIVNNILFIYNNLSE